MAAGRPRLEINWEEIGELLISGCSVESIAQQFAISTKTLYDRCKQDLGKKLSLFSQEKRTKGENLLRDAQFKNAMNGNTSMQIWLGKQRLDQKEPNSKESEISILDMKKEFHYMKCELENKDIEIQALKAQLNESNSKQ